MVYFSHSHVCVKCRKRAKNCLGVGCALIKAFWTVSQWVNPGVSNRTKSNKNPIELNRTIGVRLGSAIEQNEHFAVSSIFEPIEPIEQNRTNPMQFCSDGIS